MGKLYGIDVGPGNPELLTLRTHRILNAANVIFCPEREAEAGSSALDIIQGLLEDIKAETVDLVYPMYYHDTQLREMWKQNAGRIARYLDRDRTGVFITLGDPTVYSTLIRTLPYIEEAGVEMEVVPSVTSFRAMADSMRVPPVAWSEDPVAVPMYKNSSGNLRRMFREHDNVVLMKSSTDPQVLLKVLKKNYLGDRFVLTTKTSIGEERLATDLEELERYDMPYLSTVATKK